MGLSLNRLRTILVIYTLFSFSINTIILSDHLRRSLQVSRSPNTTVVETSLTEGKQKHQQVLHSLEGLRGFHKHKEAHATSNDDDVLTDEEKEEPWLRIVRSRDDTDTNTETGAQSRRRYADAADYSSKFILHVGLPSSETGTSFLQCALCSQANITEPVLLKDNWVYLGTCPSSTCRLEHRQEQFLEDSLESFFTNQGGLARPKLNVQFTQRVHELFLEGRNVLVIFEGLHMLQDGQIEALAEFLNDYWDVQVLVAYRPLYSWLLTSKYKSGYSERAWPGEANRNGFVGGAPVLPFHLDDRGDFTALTVRSIETLTQQQQQQQQQHPTETSMLNFARHFANVSIVPLHNLPPVVETGEGVDSVLNYLFCGILKDSTPYTCQALHADAFGSGDVSNNPSVSLNYDMLATTAHEAGIVDKNYRRIELRERIRFQQEKVLNRSANDFPLVCLPNATLNRLENLSWTLEKRLFSPATIENELAHKKGFAKAVAKKTYCWIDTNRTLENPAWRSFLSLPKKERGRE